MSFECDVSLFDGFGPENVMLLRDPTIKLSGFLVIDNSYYGTPAGGLRMAPDLNANEIIKLARTESLRFSSFGIPMGGAKSGIIENTEVASKPVLISRFGELIKSILKDGDYYPQPGLGTLSEDTDKILRITGKPEMLPKNLGIINTEESIKKCYTGESTFYCVELVYQTLNSFLSANNQVEWNSSPKIMIEGFGRVGSEIARLIKSSPFTLTGISTLKGAIFKEEGLDIDRLLKLRKTEGDDLVNQYEDKDLVNTEYDKLFDLTSDYETDFIIPGARPEAINQENINNIQVQAIIPASSHPYQSEIMSTLEEKNILAFPDFISSAGDILELSTRSRSNEQAEISSFIRSEMKKKIKKIFEKAYKEKKITPYAYAKSFALKELKTKLERREKHSQGLHKVLKK
ncbi:MAG: Glu/Leu/Phe/Val dehydrogenase [Promethearchaeota archaeon]|nr:MAG: Glu/Leu/Phe/Val dehydrogenase [Candidatus Lokiarchaeota archaeon]